MAEKNTIDLVCGMDLTPFTDATEVSYKEDSFYFCGKGCGSRFKKNPKKFQKEPLIRLENVWKVFEMSKGVETKALRGLSLRIWKGDFIAIIGASGSGKSTALNMIGILDKPTSGDIFLNGKDVSILSDEEKAQLRSEMFGFIFQQYNLIPWLTAYENANLPLIFARKKDNPKQIHTNPHILETLEKRFEEVGLKERMNHRPFELSGGEQQRTAILRALANDPKVILGDEPTGNLDSETGKKILEMLIDLNKIHEKTLIIVTHDAGIAEKADQIITLKDGHLVRDHQVHRRAYTEQWK